MLVAARLTNTDAMVTWCWCAMIMPLFRNITSVAFSVDLDSVD